MQTGLIEKGRRAGHATDPLKNESHRESSSYEEAQRQAKNRGRKSNIREMPRPHKLRLYQYLYDNVSIPIKLGFRVSQLLPDESQYLFAVVQLAVCAHGIKYGVLVESDLIERKTGLNKSRQIKARRALIEKGLLADMGRKRIINGKESVYVCICLYPGDEEV